MSAVYGRVSWNVDLCSGYRQRGAVTTPGPDQQVSATRRTGLYLNGPVSSILLLVGRDISDGVLVTNITRDSFTNRDCLFQGLRQEHIAACLPRELRQHMGVAVRIFFLEKSNGVDNGIALLRHGHDLGQIMLAGIVTAVADYDQHFLVAVALLQMLERGRHGIVQGRLSIGNDSGQGSFQL